jgi:hypothetical protein
VKIPHNVAITTASWTSTKIDKSGIASSEKPNPEMDWRKAAKQMMTVTASKSLSIKKH